MRWNLVSVGLGLISSFAFFPCTARSADLSHLPNELSTLSAKIYSPAREASGRVELPTSAKLVIPSEIPIISGSTGSLGFATIEFDEQYTCVYRGDAALLNIFAKAKKYTFLFCLPGRDRSDNVISLLLKALKLKAGQSISVSQHAIATALSGTNSEPTLIQAKIAVAQWIQSASRTGQIRAVDLNSAKLKNGNAFPSVFHTAEDAFVTLPSSLKAVSGAFSGTHRLELEIDSEVKCRYQALAFQGCTDAQNVPLSGNGFPVRKKIEFKLTAGATSNLPLFATASFSVRYGSVIAPPTLIVGLTPPILTKTAEITFPVTVLSTAPQVSTTVYRNGALVAQSTALSFQVVTTLQDGPNTFDVRAIDSSGGSAQVSISNITLDRTAPVIQLSSPEEDGTIRSLDIPIAGTANESLKSITANGRPLKLSPDRRSFSGVIPALIPGGFSIAFVAQDDLENTRSFSRNVMIELENEPVLPPDPIAVAPENDPSSVTDMANSTAFLYAGQNPIQTGVAPGTIEPEYAAVLRGKVLLVDGSPLKGVKVIVKDHPEFGQTLTREDGSYDLAVNGGKIHVLEFSKPQFLSAQRSENVSERDYTVFDDVVLARLSTEVTQVALGSSETQVARAEVVSDGDGDRRATLIFPADTGAELIMPDGSTRSVSSLNIRATEYTVGPNGEKAMPAVLPTTSAYTYAVELSADEAIAAGAASVQFTKPVYHYVENFLGFPVGTQVPSGYYNTEKAEWVASNDGKVIKILSLSNGMAEIDLGNGQPASASELVAHGFTNEERQKLATLYTADQTLFRTPIPHFTTWDLNFPWFQQEHEGMTPDYAKTAQQNKCRCSKVEPGSIIDVQNQILRESIPIVGTPFSLNYASDRTKDRDTAYSIRIPINGAEIPARRMYLEVHIAGRKFEYTFAPFPHQFYDFQWDGRDAYGRQLDGPAQARIIVGFEYSNTYMAPAVEDRSFGIASATPLSVGTRNAIVDSIADYTVELGTADSRSLGLGSWSLSEQHLYTGVTLYRGDGTQQSASNSGMKNITTFLQGLQYAHGITEDNSRDIIVADYAANQIVRHSSGGVRKQVYSNVNQPTALASNGINLYVVESGSGILNRIDRDGTVFRVAGGGFLFPGNTPTLATNLNLTGIHSIVRANDGTIYLGGNSNRGILRLGTDGFLSVIPNTSAQMSGNGVITALAANRTGQTIYAATDQGKLWSLNASGSNIREIALPVNENIYTLAISPNNEVYYGSGPGNIYRVRGTSVVRIAGGGTDENGAALQTNLIGHRTLYYSKNGDLLIGSFGRVAKMGEVLPRARAGEAQIASDGGNRVFSFDSNGKHLETSDTFVGSVIYSFEYDERGYLISVQDTHRNTTRIERDSNHVATAIISPDGLRTDLLIDANGLLRSISNPARETYSFDYAANTNLLTRMTYPKGNSSTFAYGPDTRLISDKNALNANTRLGREGSPENYLITHTSAEGVSTRYGTSNINDGAQVLTTFLSDGTTDRTVFYPDARVESISANGLRTESTSKADPRFGMQTPYTSQQTVRLPNGVTSITDTSRTFTTNGGNFTITEEATTYGNTFTNQYTSANRTHTTTSPLGRQRLTRLNEHSQVEYSVMGDLAGTSYTYDTRGRLVQSLRGDRSTSMSYDSSGFLSSITNPIGQVTSFEYDAAGRVVRQSLPGSREVLYSYDPNGNLTSISPPGRSAHSFEYDAIDQQEEYRAPASSNGDGRTQYRYNLDRNITEIVRPDGSRIEYRYDPSTGKLAEMTTAEGSYFYTYHANTGQLAQVVSPQGGSESNQTVQYTWNGPLLTHNKWSGPVNGTIEIDYRYDFQENLRFVSVQGESNGRGYATQYAYDRDGLLRSIGGSPLYRSPINGLLQASTWQTGGIFLEYNPYGEITNRLYRSVNAEFWNTVITRDALGRISNTEERLPGSVNRTSEYRYDSSGRLEAVLRDGNVDSTYSYDLNGNRLTQNKNGITVAGVYDAQDRLLSYGDEQFTYNENGEIISRTNSSTGDMTTYSYSAFGNLRSATLPDGKTIRYVIDDQGRRIGKKVNGNTTQMFLYENSLRPAAQLDANGNLVSMFFYATLANAPDRMVKKNTDGSFSDYTILHDDRGSIRYVLHQFSGALVQEIEYDEFGIITRDTNPGFQPFGFAGGLYDSDTKLTHFGAREYDASTGRWTTKDPILFAGGDTNLYGYVLNDPINLIDPTGLSGADTNRILMYSNQIINRMTNLGLRTSNPYMNNIQRSLGDLTGDRVGNSMFLGCYEQAYVTQNHLEGKQYDDQWSFTSQNNGVHHWIEGRSSNANDPVLRIDPWKGTIETR